MKYVSFIEHKNQSIVFVDYKLCKNENEMIDAINEVADFLKRSFVCHRTLSDFTGTFGTDKFMARAKELGKEVFSIKTTREAILGITFIKKILLRAYNIFAADKIMAFDTREQALEYLVD